MHPLPDFVVAFGDAIRAAGLGSPKIQADGQIHRFRGPEDKPGHPNSWYVLHPDSPPAGAFGNWRTGEKTNWCARPGGQLSDAERRLLKANIAAARAAHDRTKLRNQQAAAERARKLWAYATPADPRHPYLVAKEIGPHGLRQNTNDRLLVPVTAGDELVSLQFIAPDGVKRFLTNGRTAGCFYQLPAARLPAPILIGEGLATVATLVEVTGAPGVVAFNVGNLKSVAEAFRRRHPDAEIIIAGDNDALTPGNPGATLARAAARAVGAKLLLPDFAAFDRPASDWNDYVRLTRARTRAAPANQTTRQEEREIRHD